MRKNCSVNMKKILFILSTELSAYQMLTHLKQNKEKCIVDSLIQISRNNSLINKSNQKFSTISRKLFLIKQPALPIFFSILKFWNIFLLTEIK